MIDKKKVVRAQANRLPGPHHLTECPMYERKVTKPREDGPECRCDDWSPEWTI